MNSKPYEVLKLLSCGVYVVGVRDRSGVNAFTASWIVQVSFKPLLIVLSINPHHRSYGMICNAGGFTINVLAKEQLDLAAHFGRPGKKLEGVDWAPSPHFEAPLLRDTLGWLEVEAQEEYPAGDHRLILGRAIAGKVLKEGESPAGSTPPKGGEPLLYRDTGDLDQASELFPEEF